MTNYVHFFKVQVGILSLVCLVYIFAEIFDIHPPKQFPHLHHGLRRKLRAFRRKSERRRSLAVLDGQLSHSALPPWAQYNLVDVSQKPDPSSETALFWHIPKSGGTTAKRLYECLGQTLANRLGANPRFGHDKDTKIVVFQPFATAPEINFVNVDTTTKPGILRAAKLGLVPSKKVDMIFTSDVNFAADHLFDSNNKGRIFALFRNPVDRSVSKFYYLQTATWERTYRPEWVGMSITEWATNHNLDENFIVKKIVGKKLSDQVDLGDLIVAKDIVRQRFIVGLMNDMEEGIRRFNIVLGLDTKNEKGQMCMDQYFSKKDKVEVVAAASDAAAAGVGSEEGRAKATDGMNSNPHPKIKEGSPEYALLAERNSLDMILFNYITLLYKEQKKLIQSYAPMYGHSHSTTSLMGGTSG